MRQAASSSDARRPEASASVVTADTESHQRLKVELFASVSWIGMLGLICDKQTHWKVLYGVQGPGRSGADRYSSGRDGASHRARRAGELAKQARAVFSRHQGDQRLGHLCQW